MSLCWRGSSRKYHIQIQAHTKLTSPRTTNAPRQPISTINAATIGGATALARRGKACESVRDALGKTTFLVIEPVGHRPGRRRKGRALAETENEPHHQ